MTIGWRQLILSLGLPLLVIACAARERIEPLAPQFAVNFPIGPRTQKPMSADPLSGSDQPGALYDEGRLARNGSGQPDSSNTPISRAGLSSTVRENVTVPGDEPVRLDPANPAAAPATGPATTVETTEPAAPIGQFIVLGGVVAEVNGVPIYANKVLQLVEPILAARAKELNREQFYKVATKEITLQMVALRNLELEYAAAERNLDEKDKQIADAMTEQWRGRQISAAGGSVELAKRRAAERGEDFDELVHQQYRVAMSRIYYEKKLVPKIQVSASDMREYYDRNRNTVFTERGAARFRLIKIDVKKSGGREPALDKVTGLRNRIVKAGQPFEEIARSVNDDPNWLRSGGDLGAAIEAGAFKIEPVEKAVWVTPVGKVTEIIEAGDAFYIAKVESKTEGKVLPFESEEVQSKIAETLRSEQFRKMRRDVQDQLFKDAMFRSDAQMMNTAIEMAMQNYPRWAQ
ncbi:MAG: peptidylprolyl isomerase [Tepidisphaeraceae bacterium]